MPDFQATTLAVILLGTAVIAVCAWAVARGTWSRLLLLGIIAGLLVYSGIGAAVPEVPAAYRVDYFALLLAIVFSYLFFERLFGAFSRRAGLALERAWDGMESRRSWSALIWIYLLLHLVPLLYPAMRLGQLASPPMADVATRLLERFSGEGTNPIAKLAEYAQWLLMPFAYIALFKLRRRMWAVMAVLLAVLYLRLADMGYLARSEVGMALLVVALALWVDRPRSRKRLLIASLALLPFLVTAFHLYSVVRMKGSVEGMTFGGSLAELVRQETSFPASVAAPIMASQARVNLRDYMVWMVTLPVPKVLTGEIAGARINYEISELIHNQNRGEAGWYIVLPGLVGESIYLLGGSFFWLHGIFIGFLAALVLALVQSAPKALFLLAYIVALFSYFLNRGGIAGVLPELVNSFMLFYLYLLASVWRLAGSEGRKPGGGPAPNHRLAPAAPGGRP